MGFREGRLVNAGLVGADGTQRIEIGKDPGAVGLQAIIGHRLGPCWLVKFAAIFNGDIHCSSLPPSRVALRWTSRYATSKFAV